MISGISWLSSLRIWSLRPSLRFLRRCSCNWSNGGFSSSRSMTSSRSRCSLFNASSLILIASRSIGSGGLLMLPRLRLAMQPPAVYPFARPKGSAQTEAIVSDFLPHPFWNFSLELYAGEGVAEACLDLQERRGCDVNILLYCCWLGASGRPTLTAERLRAILKVSDVWQAEIVRPLRQVRQLLKDKPWTETLPETVEAARRRVADAELAAEHAEQLKLASLHAPPADRDRPIEKRLRAAVGNLGVYAVCLGVVPDAKDRAAVVALMKGTFPTLTA